MTWKPIVTGANAPAYLTFMYLNTSVLKASV